jgi:hypothetical protein
MKSTKIQYELPGTENAFNLAGETVETPPVLHSSQSEGGSTPSEPEPEFITLPGLDPGSYWNLPKTKTKIV